MVRVSHSDRLRVRRGSRSVPSSDLTVAFSLAALDRLARPEAALEDAAEWARHVGIVSAEPSFLERRRVREAAYPQDFLSGPRSKAEALDAVRATFETERYVFVGTTDADERTAEEFEWAYRSVTAAATAADWLLSEESSAED